jgi:hypothetical protein
MLFMIVNYIVCDIDLNVHNIKHLNNNSNKKSLSPSLLFYLKIKLLRVINTCIASKKKKKKYLCIIYKNKLCNMIHTYILYENDTIVKLL